VTARSARRNGAADPLLARAAWVAWVAGGHGLRCLISYRAIGRLAAFTHERQAYGDSLGDAECAAVSAVLDRLEATPGRPPGSEQTAADQVIGCDTSKKPRPYSLPPA